MSESSEELYPYLGKNDFMILKRVISGHSYKEIADDLDLSQPNVRTKAIRVIARYAKNLFEEGVSAGESGTHCTPALSWIRANGSRIIAEIERSVARQESENDALILAANILEKRGYQDLSCKIRKTLWLHNAKNNGLESV